MSTEAAPCRTLAEYVRQLVVRLAEDEPAAFEELRRTVGARSATLGLDDETVLVHVQGGEILVHPSVSGGDGTGWTDGNCVLDLLDGYDDVTAAVLDGRLRVQGALEDVTAMFAAIDIILDTSARSPALQSLADDLRADPCRPLRPPRLPGDTARSTVWRIGDITQAEHAVLTTLDLLPDRPSPVA